MNNVEQLLSQLVAEFKQLNTTMTTIAERLEGAQTTKSSTKKVAAKTKYIVTNSPLTSKAFPRRCVRPVNEGEQADYVYDNVEDAVLDTFQHGIAPEDIDVFLPDGTATTGVGYLS